MHENDATSPDDPIVPNDQIPSHDATPDHDAMERTMNPPPSTATDDGDTSERPTGSSFDDSISRRMDALFNEGTGAEVSRRRSHRRRRKAIVAGVVVTALAASTVWASFASGDSAGIYRTAAVSTQDVAQQLTSVATIEPVSQAAVAFPTSGTVATVDVAIGDTVEVGQQLATLDTESLTQTLHTKEAALATAQLNLSKTLAGESVTTSGGTSGAGGSATSMGTSVVTTSAAATMLAAIQTASQAPAIQTSGGSSSADLTAARQAVVDAQSTVDDALAAADAAMDNATTVCSALGSSSSSTTTTTVADSTDALTACTKAITEVQSAQADVATAQRTLATASSNLDAMLQAETDSSDSSSSGPAGTGGTTAPSGSGSDGYGVGVGGSSTTSTVSSEDLIAAQKAVDAAELAVTVAQQAVAQATIVSPIAGTVVSVGIESGDSASAGSTTQNVIIQGRNGYEVVTTISIDDIVDVAVGQSAVVVPDGSDEQLDGKVVAISQTPDSRSSTTSFRVTVGLTDPMVELGNGSTGTVTVTTDGATSAVAVPTSAVTTDGDMTTVTVVTGSSTEDVTVTVGAVGAEWTQIKSGLEVGQRVLLADLDAPLPSEAATSSDTERNGTTGSGGTADFPGGGFPGGPATGPSGAGGG